MISEGDLIELIEEVGYGQVRDMVEVAYAAFAARKRLIARQAKRSHVISGFIDRQGLGLWARHYDLSQAESRDAAKAWLETVVDELLELNSAV